VPPTRQAWIIWPKAMLQYSAVPSASRHSKSSPRISDMIEISYEKLGSSGQGERLIVVSADINRSAPAYSWSGASGSFFILRGRPRFSSSPSLLSVTRNAHYRRSKRHVPIVSPCDDLRVPGVDGQCLRYLHRTEIAAGHAARNNFDLIAK
jgi:hypothetical protein